MERNLERETEAGQPVHDDEIAALEGIRAADIGSESVIAHAPISAEQEAAQIEAENPPPAPMDRAAFWVVFKAAFSVPMMLGADFAPLAIQPEEEAAARAASDALYQIILIYRPQLLLPQGETFALLMTCGPFLLAKAMLVREILNARRARRAEEIEASRRAMFGQGPRKVQPQGQGEPQPDFKSRREPPPQNSPLSWMDQEQAA